MAVWRHGPVVVPRPARLAALAGLVVVAGLVLSACGPTTRPASTAAPSSGATQAAAGAVAATQTSEGGQVTVKVTWTGPTAGPVFAVVLDTHAVDLDGYDLAKLAVLRVDGRELRPSGWNAPKGGHHREGKLTFPPDGGDGKPTIGQGARALELVIRDVAGVPERSFRWAL